MLVACGFVRATTADGAEFTFTPSIGRIAALGDPHEIVQIYADLYGPDAATTAAYVLAGLCDQDDATQLQQLTGCHEFVDGRLVWRAGTMPVAEMLIIAHHLMVHGVMGQAPSGARDTPPPSSGAFSAAFNAHEYIAAARVHLGISGAEAEALSMTELQRLFEVKFPRANDPNRRDVPSREEYDAAMRAHDERLAAMGASGGG